MTVNYFQQANKFFREGKLDNAINAYRKYIAVNPNFFHAYQNLGDALIKVQRFDEAVEAFRKAVDLNSQAVWSFFKLGELLYKKEEFEDAVFFLRRAVKLKPDVAEFNLGLGNALMSSISAKGDAPFFLRRAQELNPYLAEAYIDFGFIDSIDQKTSQMLDFYGNRDNQQENSLISDHYVQELMNKTRLKSYKTRVLINVLFVLYGELESNGGYQAQLYADQLEKLGVNCVFAVPDSSYVSDLEQQTQHRLSFHVLPFSALLSPHFRFPFADNSYYPDIIHAWTPREIVRKFVETLLESYPSNLVIHLEDNEEYLTEAQLGMSFNELVKLPDLELDKLIPDNCYHPTRGRNFLNQAKGLTMIIDSLNSFNIKNVEEIVLNPQVDERLFYPRRINDKLRSFMGISEIHLVLAYTGNVHSGNLDEVHELYRAVEILNQQGCPTILLRTGLNSNKLGVESWGRMFEKYLGWVERKQVPEVLAAADILVQPGIPGCFNDQRFPSKLLEYFAMGRPVILPKTNLGLTVKHLHEAYVVDRSDAQSIAEAVQEIKSDQDLARRLSDGSVEFYLRQLEQGLIGNKLNDYYHKLTKNISYLENAKREGTTIFLVTPCLNAATTIDYTIKSVISQSGDFWIRYHIQDGGSTDLTVERLQYWESVLSQKNSYIQCRGVYFSWVSEPDKGMYDAILKGFDNFDIMPKEFITWINADDALMPDALSAICLIVKEYPDIEWVGGPQYVFETDIQQKVLQRSTPTPTVVIREGLCDGRHWEMLQQEGTFFSKALWFKSKHGLKDFDLAGDWNLWREMAHYGVYYQYENPLGAFRKRPGQLSVKRIEDYRAEIERVVPMDVRNSRFQQLYKDYKEEKWKANLIKSDDISGKLLLCNELVQELYEKLGDNKVGREEKLAYYRNLAKNNPDSIEILLLLGNALEESEFFEQALAVYYQAIQLENDSIQVQDKFVSALSRTDISFCVDEHHYILLGEIQKKRGKWDQALVAFQNAIKANPHFYMSYHHLGDVMFAITNYRESVVQYNKSINLNSSFAYTYINLGNTLVQIGLYEEAVVNYQKGIELAPDSFWAYYNLGDALACLGKIDEASLYYCQGVKLDPNPQ